jgi:hypothetical protein
MPGDLDVRAERGRVTDDLVARHDPGQCFTGEPEQLEQFRVPVDRVDVEEQRAAGGGDVGDELAGEVVDQPGVGGRHHPVGGDVAA